MKPKRKHGGKRAGAGRKKDPNSIRSQLAKAKEGGYKHSRTTYQIWTGDFLAKNLGDNDVLTALHLAWDKSTRALDTNGEHRTFISRHKAVLLCKLSPELRAELMYAPLMRFIEQYEGDQGMFGDRARRWRKELDSD